MTGSGVPFSLLTLQAFYDNLKEYPPGVPLLDYGAGRITYWAETILMDDKGTWTVGRLDAELAPPANEAAPTQREPGVLGCVHTSQLFSVQSNEAFMKMTLASFASKVLEHLAKHCISPDHRPVNLLRRTDVFHYPLFTWRGTGDAKQPVPVCLKVALHGPTGGPWQGRAAGHIERYGHSMNYRQLLLGQDGNGEHVWQPLCPLMLLLLYGPYKLEDNKAALERTEPRLKKKGNWVGKVQVDCMHLRACQARRARAWTASGRSA